MPPPRYRARNGTLPSIDAPSGAFIGIIIYMRLVIPIEAQNCKARAHKEVKSQEVHDNVSRRRMREARCNKGPAINQYTSACLGVFS
jgi:hypothetical protein